MVSLEVILEARGVSVREGAMQFTRILGLSSLAALRVKASRAPLAEAMATWLGKPWAHATVLKNTTEPGVGPLERAGVAAFRARAAERKFRLYAAVKSLGVVDLRGFSGMDPTAYTKPRSGPRPFTAGSTNSGLDRSRRVNGELFVAALKAFNAASFRPRR